MERLPSPGLFWLPENETDRFFGQLEGEQGSIVLSIIGRLEDQDATTITVTTTYFDELPSILMVHGIIRGKLVTLLNLRKTRTAHSVPGFEEAVYRPEFVMFGVHLSGEPEDLPIGMTVRYSHLLHWHGQRGFIESYAMGESGWIGGEWTYSFPPAYEWNALGMSISLMGGLDPKRDWDTLNVLEYGYFRIRAESPKSIEDWFQDVIDPLHNMVKFAIFDVVALDQVRLLFPDGVGSEATSQLDHYTGELVVNRKQSRDLRRKPKKNPDLLFRPRELTSESLSSFLTTDLQTYVVRARFIAYEQTEMQADEFFLAYVRLLESLHRLLHPVSELEIVEHRQRLETIGRLLTDADREFVTGRLSHGYEPSLESRLHQLAKPWKPKLKAVVGGGANLAAEIQAIGRHRNFLAHELSEELRELDSEKLHRVSGFLMVLSRLAALVDAKFTVTDAWDAVSHTELFQYWSSHCHTLRESQ